MYDSNPNWVKVTVARRDEVFRVHAAITDALARERLRPPIDDVIVVQAADRHVSEGVEAVRYVVEQEFGSPDWIRIEAGDGNVMWIYGPYPA